MDLLGKRGHGIEIVSESHDLELGRKVGRAVEVLHVAPAIADSHIRSLCGRARRGPQTASAASAEPPNAESSKGEPPRAGASNVEPSKLEPHRPAGAERRPTIDPVVVSSVIGRYRADVLKCIAQGKKDAKLKGTLTLQFQVDLTGAVRHAQTLSTLANPPVAACVAKAAQGWKFPARQSGQIATVN